MPLALIPSEFSASPVRLASPNRVLDMWPDYPGLKHELLRQLSVTLREPLDDVRRKVRMHQRFHAQLEYRRHHKLSKAFLQQHAASFCVPQIDAYRELLLHDSRARILATFHFGDFIYGLNCLVSRVSHSGAICVLSLERSSTVFWHNMQGAFGISAATAQNELVRDHTTVASLSRFLRKDGNTLVLFCDLPRGCGEVADVFFLARKAWFPRGPATLAVLNRVPIVPVICIKQAQHNEVIIYPQIEPDVLPGETRITSVGRITQQLAATLEACFRRNPEQWRYLNLLPQYFISPCSAIE